MGSTVNNIYILIMIQTLVIDIIWSMTKFWGEDEK